MDPEYTTKTLLQNVCFQKLHAIFVNVHLSDEVKKFIHPKNPSIANQWTSSCGTGIQGPAFVAEQQRLLNRHRENSFGSSWFIWTISCSTFCKYISIRSNESFQLSFKFVMCEMWFTIFVTSLILDDILPCTVYFCINGIKNFQVQ